MAQLNEDVLRLIFDYFSTPLEWIQVSQVCKLWKAAASKQWRKIQEINYLDNDAKWRLKFDKKDLSLPVISTKTAENIFYFAAPFVKVLSRCGFDERRLRLLDKTLTIIKFGPFMYKLKDFDDDKALHLLAQNSTSITEIRFDKEPLIDTLKRLFENNKIRKIDVSNFDNFYNYVPTDNIEELVLKFTDVDKIKSYSGRFPNLKKLELILNLQDCRIQEAISLILSHFVGVLSLRLEVREWGKNSGSCKAFMDIAKLSQLEHLTIKSNYARAEAAGFFLTHLAQGCRKLRSIELLRMRVSDQKLEILLTQFRLEKLTIDRLANCRLIVLPWMITLSELKMRYYVDNLDVTNFCIALKKMPKLKFLELEADTDVYYRTLRNGSLIDKTWHLVCRVATVAALQNKDVVLEDITDRRNIKKLRMLRKGVASRGTGIEETLTVAVKFWFYTSFVEKVKKFVKDTLTYFDLVVEGEEDLRFLN